MVIVRTTLYHSPIGDLEIGSIGPKICLCDWVGSSRIEENKMRIGRLLNATFKQGRSSIINKAIGQLEAYFMGYLREFNLPLALAGTDFQKKVWTELSHIPYGATISYGTLAQRVGSPNGQRAVALANARNAISIILPCHRVIGATNKLVGYSGGLKAKHALITLERDKLALPLLL